MKTLAEINKSFESDERFIRGLPIVIRLDGKNFSKWTKQIHNRSCKLPYDQNFIFIMNYVTKVLIKETNAIIGYTISDEITLILYNEDINSDLYFGGRKNKILSVLSSIATAHFNDQFSKVNDTLKLAYFDCRANQYPDKLWAVNSLLWRENDGTRNSINTAARHYFSHNTLESLRSNDKLDLLHEIGINWNDYNKSFKRGTYHNKDGKVDMPIFKDVKNRVDVIFNNQEPEV